jgi:hypothetical protein
MFEKVIYITSDNRSGSTLLDLLLGNHKDIISIGELRRLNQCLNDNCMCGRRIIDCYFWQKVEHTLGRPLSQVDTFCDGHSKAARIIAKTIAAFPGRGYSFRLASHFFPFLREDAEVVANFVRIYEAICKLGEVQFIVDSSKAAYYFKLLYMFIPQKIKILYLTRDGRGVAYSKMKREGVRLEQGAKGWVLNNLMIQMMSLNIPGDRIKRVRYEDLCEKPRRTLQMVCDFVGIDFQDDILKLNKNGKHNIGGSPHKYDKENTKISLDDRWKQALSPQELSDFCGIAGWMNRRLGYY